MSEHNMARHRHPPSATEIVSDIFEAISSGNFDSAAAPLGEGVVLVVHRPNVETGTFTGRDEVSRWFGRWFGAFAPGYKMEVEAVREFGDRVFVVHRHHGEGRTSGVPVEMRNGSLVWVREGRVVRIELYGELEEGLGAAASP